MKTLYLLIFCLFINLTNYSMENQMQQVMLQDQNLNKNIEDEIIKKIQLLKQKRVDWKKKIEEFEENTKIETGQLETIKKEVEAMGTQEEQLNKTIGMKENEVKQSEEEKKQKDLKLKELQELKQQLEKIEIEIKQSEEEKNQKDTEAIKLTQKIELDKNEIEITKIKNDELGQQKTQIELEINELKVKTEEENKTIEISKINIEEIKKEIEEIKESNVITESISTEINNQETKEEIENLNKEANATTGQYNSIMQTTNQSLDNLLKDLEVIEAPTIATQ